jgi:AAA family ATP:ADP antiporter
MLTSLFLLLVSYYVVKTVREPLILATGGAEAKSLAAFFQALVLILFIPLYGWFSSKVDRMKLVVGVLLFFIACIELFYVGAHLKVPNLGFIFYIWVGIFSLCTIAQFWSYANDIYNQESGARLFAIIGIAAPAGSLVGSWLAEKLFEMRINPFDILQVTAGLLVVHLLLYWIVNRREARQARVSAVKEALGGPGGFALVLQRPYLRLVAGLIVILNVVNTNGEYILGRLVVQFADARVLADPTLDKGALIGAFYGNYFLWVNIAGLLLQTLLVSRLVKHLGMGGVLLALPIVAFGAYGLVAIGASMAVTRWAKTAENSTDYSIMNTARQMLWLPTSREEKYKAKQAIDSFFVRVGDMISWVFVVVGGQMLGLGTRGFGALNLVLVVAWLMIAGLVVRENLRLTAESQSLAA